MTLDPWKNIELEDVSALRNAREQLHQAAQVVAAVGRTYHPKTKDDRFASFSWNSQIDMLQGSMVEGNENFSAALEPSTFTLHLIAESNDSIANFCFNGKNQQQALLWLEEQLLKLGTNGSLINLQLPYKIPAYTSSKGKNFYIDDPAHFQEISHYYSNAQFILNTLLDNSVKTSSIKCCPHHFDLTTLITLHDTGNPKTSTSIGIGMSLGNDHFDEPYFYLTPRPYPNFNDLPALEPGMWYSEDWVGGVLTATALISASKKTNQRVLVTDFFRNGLKHLNAALEN